MHAELEPIVALPAGVGRAYLLHHGVCPVGLEAEGTLRVVVHEDSRIEALGDLCLRFDRQVTADVADKGDVALRIERLVTGSASGAGAMGDAPDAHGLGSDARDLTQQPPVIRYVNLLVRDAFEAGASDVHLESTRDGVRARYRVDGVMQSAMAPPPGLGRAVISRIKLLADLDIAESRRPQDGRVRVRLETRDLDLRVSAVPSGHGESVALRLLDRAGTPHALEDLGLPSRLRDQLSLMVTRPHGLVLVTGPTGSGKTTTLYAALGLRNGSSEKIITVEDPIEFPLEHVIQVPVERQAGVSFGSALRSILRQDPDVLMVGEMRDEETAELAVQAALTGHVVLSTLHTNDALGAIARLTDLGVPRYLIAATLEGVLGQRLVRRICPGCREGYVPSRDVAEMYGVAQTPMSRGTGCPDCRGTGFDGRIGIFELVRASEALRRAVAEGAERADLEAIAMRDGMDPMRKHGLSLALQGLTTLEEVLRVTPS